jgi:hypothetical protein
MIDHILVCPFSEKLLAKLKHRKIIIYTDDFDNIQNIHKKVSESNELHAIKIQTKKSLSDISFHDEWANIPLAIYSCQFGKYKDFLRQLNIIRKLNIRIFLSSQHDFNFIGLRILSSLNLSCGLYFDEEPFNWDSINDLMHYAIYSGTQHAAIEPFDWLVSHYEPDECTDYNFVYFNNPEKYLHINKKEQIALTAVDLLNKNYISKGIKSLDNINDNKKYIDFLNFRYEILIQMTECSFCPAYRICLGKFSNHVGKEDTCKTFFSDFLDAADYYYSKNKTINQIWQL